MDYLKHTLNRCQIGANHGSLLLVLKFLIATIILNLQGIHGRYLEPADYSQSVISGTGISDFYAHETVEIIVQAKYINGSDKLEGGDLFMARITNECAQALEFGCFSVSGQVQVIDHQIHQLMIDHGNGTYSFSYTATKEGTLTISVYLLTQGGVLSEFFANGGWSSTPTQSFIKSTINDNWSTINVFGAGSGWVTGRYYFYVQGPITDDVNFYCEADDSATLNLNGPSVHTCTPTGAQYTAAMVLDDWYELRLNYAASGLPGFMKFYWSYGPQARIIIPSSKLYSQQYVGPGPINVLVYCGPGSVGLPTYPECTSTCGDGITSPDEVCDDADLSNTNGCSSDCLQIKDGWACSGIAPFYCEECSDGYYPDPPSNPSECITSCGDGIRAGAEVCDDGDILDSNGCNHDCSTVNPGWSCDIATMTICTEDPIEDDSSSNVSSICGDGSVAQDEECDDGNDQANDGCDAQCNIEVDWICNGESNSVCQKCDVGYTPDKVKQSCKVKAKALESEAVAGTTLGIAGVGMIANMVSAILTNSSPQSAYSMVNFIQILLLLPLTGASIPEKVIQFLLGFLISLFNFDFIPFVRIPYVHDFANEISFEQTNSYLYLIGLENGSALLNVFNLLGMCLCLPLLHILLLCILKCIPAKHHETRIFKFLTKILNWLTFNAYIKIIYELYLLGCLTILQEASQTDLGTRGKLISFICACVLSLILALVIYCSFVQWVKSHKPLLFAKQRYFKDLFSGIRNNFCARSFCLLFLLRRSLFVVITILLVGWKMETKVYSYFIIQICYFIVILSIRPFEKIQDNIIEITNEITHSLLCGSLCYFNKENRWLSPIESAFMYSIVATTLLTSCISIVALIAHITKKYCKKKQTRVETYRNHVKIETHSQNQPNNDRSLSNAQFSKPNNEFSSQQHPSHSRSFGDYFERRSKAPVSSHSRMSNRYL